MPTAATSTGSSVPSPTGKDSRPTQTSPRTARRSASSASTETCLGRTASRRKGFSAPVSTEATSPSCCRSRSTSRSSTTGHRTESTSSSARIPPRRNRPPLPDPFPRSRRQCIRRLVLTGRQVHRLPARGPRQLCADEDAERRQPPKADPRLFELQAARHRLGSASAAGGRRSGRRLKTQRGVGQGRVCFGGPPLRA
jgi:hypothetical protein